MLTVAAGERIGQCISERLEQLGNQRRALDLKRPKAGGKHADDRERSIAQTDDPAYDISVSAETPHPKAMRQDDFVAPIWAVLLGKEGAADLHADAKSIEEIVIDAQAADQFGFAPIDDNARSVAIEGHARE